jgi:hypothetical protein
VAGRQRAGAAGRGGGREAAPVVVLRGQIQGRPRADGGRVLDALAGGAVDAVRGDDPLPLGPAGARDRALALAVRTPCGRWAAGRDLLCSSMSRMWLRAGGARKSLERSRAISVGPFDSSERPAVEARDQPGVVDSTYPPLGKSG